MLNTKVFKHIGFALKVIIALASIGYIVLKLRVFDTGIDTGNEIVFSEIKQKIPFTLLLVLLLMMVNWGLEVLKWNILVSKHEKISILACIKPVLAGVTMSVFTPNRIGEFGGKIFFLKTANRAKALVSSILGSYVQVSMTILFGAIGLTMYFLVLESPIESLPISRSWVYVLWVVSLLLFLFMILPLNNVVGKGRFANYMEVLTYYNNGEKLKVVFLSLLRYIVFTTQFALLLYLFPVQISLIEALSMITLTFLGITIVPTVAVAELGVRGSSALMFLGLYEPNQTAILYTTFLLWIINIALPAMLGVPFVFSLTFFRNKKS